MARLLGQQVGTAPILMEERRIMSPPRVQQGRDLSRATDCKLTAEDTTLAEIVQGWPTLPAAIKAGILAMVRATRGT